MAPQQIKQEFPRIFRFITEKVSNLPPTATKITLSCLLSFLLIIAITSQIFTLRNNLKNLSQINQERQNIQKEISYWKQVSEEHKSYADIYLKIASLEYRLGNTQSSSEFMKKAFSINPDTEQGRVLGEYIIR